MGEAGRRASVTVAASATCAVLYAIGSLVTAGIISPWGAGQFRPAVVIPAVFATIFGGLPGGLGAALGTLIADSAAHGQIYVRSLVSAVPGTFIGFYIFGWLLRRKFSWARYFKVSQLTLLLANVIVAFLYVFFRAFIEASYPQVFVDAWVAISLGLVAWWYVTMLPFVLLFGPPVIRAVASAFPGMISEEIKSSSVREEIPQRSIVVALMVPGLLMLLVGVGTAFADPAVVIAAKLVPSVVILNGIRVMFLLLGILLLLLGVVLASLKKAKLR